MVPLDIGAYALAGRRSAGAHVDCDRSQSAGASFGFGPNAVERRADCRLPFGPNLITPPAAQCPEVRTQLAGVLELRRVLLGVKREPLDHMRNRAP